MGAASLIFMGIAPNIPLPLVIIVNLYKYFKTLHMQSEVDCGFISGVFGVLSISNRYSSLL